MYIFAYVSTGACVCVLNSRRGAASSSAAGRLPIFSCLPLARGAIKQESTLICPPSAHEHTQVEISDTFPGGGGGEAAEDAGLGQPPRQCSTCPASQGLPGAGAKGGPGLRASPRQALAGFFPLRFPCQWDGEGGPGPRGIPAPSRGSPGSAAPNRGAAAPLGRLPGQGRGAPPGGRKARPRGLWRSRALPVVPEVMGKRKGRSFCPGHIIGDVTSFSLSENGQESGLFLRVPLCCGD